MARIPLTLVTGFLGSGKTTFLKNVARRLAHRRIVYLVNEFSALDVDGAVLGELGPNIVSVPGGSIFCKCLVGDFILNLTEIPRRFGAEKVSEKVSGTFSPLDGVLIEASGIANPKVIADMLRETHLDALYDLASIVSIADPGSFTKLLATLPNIRAQIEAADTVLLNKIDLFPEPQVATTEAALRQINPAVRILRTIRAAADIDLFAPAPTRNLHGTYADCADPHYGRFSVIFYNPVDLAALQTALRDLGDTLYRVKGFVPTPAGTVYLDMSAGGLSLEPCDRPDAPAGLAIIARAADQDKMDAWVRQAQSGAFDACPG